MNTSEHNRGFVALISIIMLSVVLLATTLSLAQFGLANRYFLLELENKNVSVKLAEACVHIARIQVYNNPLHTVTTAVTLPVDGFECTIVSVDPDSDESTVQARGVMGTAITNLEVVVDSNDGEFISWHEVQNF